MADMLRAEEPESRLIHTCTLYFVPAAFGAPRSTEISDAGTLTLKSGVIIFLLFLEYRAGLVLDRALRPA